MNGSAASTTYRMIPFAIRLQVASASGRARSKMLGAGIDQSMHSAAVRQGFSLRDFTARLSGAACVAAGQTIGAPSHRATRNSRFRMVGAP